LKTKILALLCLCFIFGQYALLILHTHDSSEDSAVTSNEAKPKKSAPSARPKQFSKERFFVHIGKAGGSSIQVMVKKSREKCDELKSAEKNGTRFSPQERVNMKQVCALATIPTGRVHLRDRLHPKRYYSKYNQFLVNLRDPIDRLVSWYSYEAVSFVKEPRWSTANETGQASDNYRRLSRECYPSKDKTDKNNGFAQMVDGGLLSGSFDAASESVTVGDFVPDCSQLARFCLRGDIMCFGHNFYNYEVYLEEIFRRMGLSADANQNDKEDIRIDVIRSEHSMEDFNRTVGLWTSQNSKEYETYQGVTPFVQSLYGRVRSIEKYDDKKKKKNKIPKANEAKPEVLSETARTALCKHICKELVVYKLALKMAANLEPQEIQQSHDDLDTHCGMDVDAVCGTTWTYRDIKSKKQIFETAPW